MEPSGPRKVTSRGTEWGNRPSNLSGSRCSSWVPIHYYLKQWEFLRSPCVISQSDVSFEHRSVRSLVIGILSVFFVSFCKEYIRGLLGPTFPKCAVYHDSFICWNTVMYFFANLMISAWFINGRGCFSSSCPSNLTLLSSIKSYLSFFTTDRLEEEPDADYSSKWLNLNSTRYYEMSSLTTRILSSHRLEV